MKIELNIGLYVNGVDDGLTVERAFAAKQRLSPHGLVRSRLVLSSTEPTLVVEMDLQGAIDFDHLARYLHQDAIAVLYDNGRGELFGPKAAEWGAFDIKQFIRF